MFRIRDILRQIQIRIWILGSVLLDILRRIRHQFLTYHLHLVNRKISCVRPYFMLINA
jgi:hypothetical protein